MTILFTPNGFTPQIRVYIFYFLSFYYSIQINAYQSTKEKFIDNK